MAMLDRDFAFYGWPDAQSMPIAVRLRLESWDAKAARSQIELGEYLDHVESLVASELASIDGPAAIALTVGVGTERSLTSGGGDLDNYLLPVVRRLGAAQFNAAWAIKHRGASAICVGPARAIPPPRAWGVCAVTTTASADTRAFKEQVAAAVPALEAAEGALEVQISYRLSARRNWSTLWKPTIDALGGVLGIPDPARRFRPNDDRIVRLGLHRTIDESLGWNIAIGICWRRATNS